MSKTPDLESVLRMMDDLAVDFRNEADRHSKQDSEWSRERNQYYKGVSRGYVLAAKLLRGEMEISERIKNRRVAP